ncbi:MAG: SMI1/KNR4 family protein [Treponema sp.]|nr:SMI1/KNR4 family protein [Treponema sp.]
MTMIIQAIKSLEDLLPLKSATEIQINDAEKQLGIKFSSEYREYLHEFGAIMADGIELSGIAKSEHRNVVSLTKKEWELNPKIPHTMYVVENAGVDGIIIWQDTNGLIYQSRPFMEPKKIAESLAEYIRSK